MLLLSWPQKHALDLEKHPPNQYFWYILSMTILKYETPISQFKLAPRPWVFLAGPTVRGNQPHLTSWRREAEEFFLSQGFRGTLIVPEFKNKTTSDKGKEWIPLWEFCGLMECDEILFWIPRTRELIGLTTNFEIGYWIARERHKITYGRPDDAFRMKYIDLMWNHDATFFGGAGCSTEIFTTLSATCQHVLDKMGGATSD